MEAQQDFHAVRGDDDEEYKRPSPTSDNLPFLSSSSALSSSSSTVRASLTTTVSSPSNSLPTSSSGTIIRPSNALWVLPRICIAVFFILLLEWIYQAQGGLGFNEDSEFGYHALCMSLFVVLFTTEASLALGKGTSLLLPITSNKNINLVFHVSCHLFSIACIILGLFAIVYYKQWSDSPKIFPFFTLYSPHSWLGVITISLFSIQFMFGIYIRSGMIAAWSLQNKILANSLHSFFGKSVYICGLMTCMTGFQDMQSSDLASSTPGMPAMPGMNATEGTGYGPFSSSAQLACAEVMILGVLGFCTLAAMAFGKTLSARGN